MSRKLLFLFFIILFVNHFGISKERSSLIITKHEAAEIKAALGKYPLLDQSIENMKNTVHAALRKPINVPPQVRQVDIATNGINKIIERCNRLVSFS